jgi:hypothetical protein
MNTTTTPTSKKVTPPPPAPVPAVEKDVSVDDDDNSEYEEIDLTNMPGYQILSAFFENEKGENIVDHLFKLTSAVEANTKMLEQVLLSKSKKS